MHRLRMHRDRGFHKEGKPSRRGRPKQGAVYPREGTILSGQGSHNPNEVRIHTGEKSKAMMGQ